MLKEIHSYIVFLGFGAKKIFSTRNSSRKKIASQPLRAILTDAWFRLAAPHFVGQARFISVSQSLEVL